MTRQERLHALRRLAEALHGMKILDYAGAPTAERVLRDAANEIVVAVGIISELLDCRHIQNTGLINEREHRARAFLRGTSGSK